MTGPRGGAFRAGIIGTGASNRLELRIQEVLARFSEPLEYFPIEVSPSATGWFEDLLEVLPKVGFIGVEVLGAFRNHATLRSSWEPTAVEVGWVDTLTFAPTDDRLPLGHNVTVTAAERLLRREVPATAGLTVLMLGAGISARSMISALMRLQVKRVVVFDPAKDRAERLVENAIEAGVASDRIEVKAEVVDAGVGVDSIVDFLPAGSPIDVFDELGHSGSRDYSWVMSAGGRSKDSELFRTGVFIDRIALCVERTACARELFTGSMLPASVTEAALHEVSDFLDKG